MNTQNKRYDIPDDVLDLTIRSLDKLAVLLEAEAAAFAVVHTEEGAQRAAELVKEAKRVREASDTLLHL